MKILQHPTIKEMQALQCANPVTREPIDNFCIRCDWMMLRKMWEWVSEPIIFSLADLKQLWFKDIEGAKKDKAFKIVDSGKWFYYITVDWFDLCIWWNSLKFSKEDLIWLWERLLGISAKQKQIKISDIWTIENELSKMWFLFTEWSRSTYYVPLDVVEKVLLKYLQ